MGSLYARVKLQQYGQFGAERGAFLSHFTSGADWLRMLCQAATSQGGAASHSACVLNCRNQPLSTFSSVITARLVSCHCNASSRLR